MTVRKRKLILWLTIILLGARIVEISKPSLTYAKFYHDLGNHYYQNHAQGKALDCYHKAIYHDPAYAPAYNQLGLIYGSRGDNKRKLKYFKKLVALNARNFYYAKAYFQVGLDYFVNADYPNAIHCFRAAVGQNNDFYAAYYFLGLLYFKLNSTEDGIQQYYNLKRLGDFYYSKQLENLFKLKG